ncbi:uncharacterized protein PHACADRAFT_196241 [Phanerochaete carnosa HHB-10118-sp]|uniref:Uncharacterized protein n=1 Tax=Phanerochaete carnosa (strain HHB-10118-sp) TaxID=650164 RepID=K5WAD9_PHACS|nr:uncharacterized protein PHACADRAFT_196241 [Phanerochaete carnosa HHB-10118-sp]EKM56185.1 hypothetical protein PHACADRAFT_196241 [Phanerochaete carnosa HHB-10118-sp]
MKYLQCAAQQLDPLQEPVISNKHDAGPSGVQHTPNDMPSLASSKENLLEEQSALNSEKEFEEPPHLLSETREAYQQCKWTYVCWLKQQEDNRLEKPKPAKDQQSSENSGNSHVQKNVHPNHSKSPKTRLQEANLLYGDEAVESEEAQIVWIDSISEQLDENHSGHTSKA